MKERLKRWFFKNNPDLEMMLLDLDTTVDKREAFQKLAKIIKYWRKRHKNNNLVLGTFIGGCIVSWLALNGFLPVLFGIVGSKVLAGSLGNFYERLSAEELKDRIRLNATDFYYENTLEMDDIYKLKSKSGNLLIEGGSSEEKTFEQSFDESLKRALDKANKIMDNHENVITTNHSTINSNNVKVIGSHNKIKGDNVTVIGSHNKVWGNNVTIQGSHNKTNDKNATMIGSHNKTNL